MNVGDKGTGKVTELSNKFDEFGQPSKWTDNRGNENYNQLITIDGNIKGQCSSRNEKPPYAVGDTVEWECRKVNQYGAMLSVKKPRENSGGGYGGNRRQRDPDNDLKIILSVASECACTIVSNMRQPQDVNAIEDLFSKYLLRRIYINKQDSISTQAALKRAVILFGVDGQGVDIPQHVLDCADKRYKSITRIEWAKDETRKMSSNNSNENTTNQQSGFGDPV